MIVDDTFQSEAEQLKSSAWPRCDHLAETLAARGPSAIPALEFALKSRVHHVRSACLRAIASVDQEKALALARLLLADRAYEVRETAAKILGVSVPG